MPCATSNMFDPENRGLSDREIRIMNQKNKQRQDEAKRLSESTSGGETETP